MKRIIAIYFAVVMALSANGIEEVFRMGKVEGQIRTAYVSQNNGLNNTDTYSTSIGGQLKYETAAWNATTLGIAAYVSQKVPFATGSTKEGKTNPDFFDVDGDSFVYMGEAYIDYGLNDMNLRIGRQLIDTPFADTDDVRMLPNSFEAIFGTYKGMDKTTLSGGYLIRWAGFDSPRGHNDSMNEFKKFGENHDSNGVYLLGMTNESIENLSIQGWGYIIDNVTDAFYADATYTVSVNETVGIEFSGQYATFWEEKDINGVETGIDGNVYGLGVRVNGGMLTLGVAYNAASNDEGKWVANGLGGGPYMTSMEEWTIDGMADVRAYQLSAELDMGNAGIEGLTFTTLYGLFQSDVVDIVKIEELDVIATYTISEAISADISYASIHDKNNNADGGGDAGYSRFLVRLSYNF